MNNSLYQDLIQLIRISLGEDLPQANFNNTNFEAIYHIANNNSIPNLLFYAIENKNLKLDKNLYNKYRDARDQSFLKDNLISSEYQSLKTLFNNNQISHLPLKGIILKELYPEPSMRTMSDIDILVKPNQRKTIHDLMEKAGYQTILYNKNNEDVYHKPPFCIVEIHTSLFEKKSIYYNFYKNIWNNQTLISQNDYEYKMTNEDFYIYLIAHFAKHYFHTGSGLRTIIDLYLFRKRYSNTLDKEYIQNKLETYELDTFHQDITNLIDVYFYNKGDKDKAQEMLNYIIESGTYGKKENAYYNRQKQYKTKTSYLIHRIFLPIKEMKNHYPILNKLIILLPFFWLLRLLTSIFKNPKNIYHELKTLIFNRKKAKV